VVKCISVFSCNSNFSDRPLIFMYKQVVDIMYVSIIKRERERERERKRKTLKMHKTKKI